jgi:hypothetical protein
MTGSTRKQITGGLFDKLAEQYCIELEQLKYGHATISVYRRSITRLGELMAENNVALDALTPDSAAELVLGADWHGDRRQYAVFVVRRFAAYLAARGAGKPSAPPTPRELVRTALRGDYEDYLRRQRGLSERTIGHCWRFADRFLDFRFGDTDIARPQARRSRISIVPFARGQARQSACPQAQHGDGAAAARRRSDSNHPLARPRIRRDDANLHSC